MNTSPSAAAVLPPATHTAPAHPRPLRRAQGTGDPSVLHKAAFAALMVALLSACSSTETSDWAGSVSDSAGVILVSNPAEGLWEADGAWTFAEEYRVGGLEAPEEAQFGLVVALDIDEAGNVYVADQQARRIKVFGPGGDFLRTIGAPGSGPGEISQALAGVWVKDGEIWAADVANLRINRYTLDGASVGAVPLDFSRGVPVRWDRVGSTVVAQMRSMAALGMAENPGGDPVVTLGEEVQDTLLVLGRGESLAVTAAGQARFTIFETEPIWDAAADGRLVSAMNSEYRVEVRAGDGTLQRVITKPFEVRPVSEADQTMILGALRRLMESQGAPPQAVDQFMAGVGFARSYPAMAQVLAGPEGTVWVQGIRTAEDVAGGGEEFNPQDLGADRWDVFDAEGRYLGVLNLPDRFTPLRMDGDAFWGVQRDEFDVNSVVRYRLVRSTG